MATKEFDLFLENRRLYEVSIEHSENQYLIELYKKMNCKNLADCQRIMQGELELLNEIEYMQLDSNSQKIFKEKFWVFKNYISKIICIEFKILYLEGKKDKEESILKKMKKYKKYGGEKTGYEKITKIPIEYMKLPPVIKSHEHVVKGRKKLMEYQNAFKWNTADKYKRGKEMLICPYCNAEYMFKDKGYRELDHILPRPYYPALIFSKFNLIFACRSCNNKKKDKLINFSFKDIIDLHQGEYFGSYFQFDKEISPEAEEFEILINKLVSQQSDLQLSEKLNVIEAYFSVPTFNELGKELNIISKYETVFQLLINQFIRFERNQKLILEILSRYDIGEPDNIDQILSDAQFVSVFDDWNSPEKEKYEILFYWRREYLKQLIKIYRRENDNNS